MVAPHGAPFRSMLADPDAAVLDICCGTGDLTMALLKHRPQNARPILAADFAHAMLSRGARKFAAAAARSRSKPTLCICRCARRRSTWWSRAFGFRNLANYEAGLREFHRVLKPGGQLGILEFSEPGGVIGKAYALYFAACCPQSGA